MSLHPDTLSWFRARQSLNGACKETTSTNFMVFGLTWPWLFDLPHSSLWSTPLEPLIYPTRSFDLPHSSLWTTPLEPLIYPTWAEHTNHNTTDAVLLLYSVNFILTLFFEHLHLHAGYVTLKRRLSDHLTQRVIWTLPSLGIHHRMSIHLT
jgi:hypothetical protein